MTNKEDEILEKTTFRFTHVSEYNTVRRFGSRMIAGVLILSGVYGFVAVRDLYFPNVEISATIAVGYIATIFIGSWVLGAKIATNAARSSSDRKGEVTWYADGFKIKLFDKHQEFLFAETRILKYEEKEASVSYKLVPFRLTFPGKTTKIKALLILSDQVKFEIIESLKELYENSAISDFKSTVVLLAEKISALAKIEMN